MEIQKTSTIVHDISSKLIPILREHGVVHASIFGSYARGDYTEESDVDILVEFRAGIKKSLLDLVDLKQHIEDDIGKVVDIVTRKGLDQKINKYVYKNCVKIL